MPEETHTIPVRMPVSEYEKLKTLAGDEGRTVSDVIRLAVERYMELAGVKTKIRVQRGGYRAPKE